VSGEDIEDVECAIVRSKVWELAVVLKLFVVTSFESAINPITNPNHVYGHSVT
jgi:hypothetical protein